MSRGASGIIRKRELLKKHYLLKKKVSMTLIKDGKEDFIQGDEGTAMGFYNMEERLDSILNAARRIGNL